MKITTISLNRAANEILKAYKEIKANQRINLKVYAEIASAKMSVWNTIFFDCDPSIEEIEKLDLRKNEIDKDFNK